MTFSTSGPNTMLKILYVVFAFIYTVYVIQSTCGVLGGPLCAGNLSTCHVVTWHGVMSICKLAHGALGADKMRFSDKHSLANEHTWYCAENISAHV